MIANVPVIKEQSGYTRASISAQALGGVVPVIDLDKKGDLQRLFASKAPAPFTDTSSVKAASLNDTAPRNNAPQPAQQQTAAQKDTPQQPEPTQAAEQQEPVRMPAMADNSPQNNIQAPQPPADAPSARFAFVPPQFAPVLGAGVLSALQHDIAEGPDGYKQGDEFKFGSAAGRQQRRVMERIENNMEANREEGRTDDRTLMMQYAAEQQRQQFMRSTEYTVAMQTVDREIRKLEGQRDQVQTRITTLKNEVAEYDQKIESATAEVKKEETQVADLKGVQRLQVQNKIDEDALNNTYTKVDDIYAKANEMHSASLKIDGTNIIYTAVEDGKAVKYKVDENGQKQRTEGGIFDLQDQIFSKKQTDGTIKYVDITGKPVDQKRKDLIDARLSAAGVKAEDVLPDHDAYKAETAKADELAQKHKVDSAGIIKAWKTLEESDKALKNEANRLGLSDNDLKTLDTRISSMEKSIADKNAQIELWKLEKTKTVEGLAKEQETLDRLNKLLAESTKFKEQLQNGTFKDAKEMEAAMPGYLKQQYEDNLAGNRHMKDAPSATANADNTSRTNGSAAAAYEGAANNSTISGKFQSAATNTTPEAAPEAPAPAPAMDDDMEYVAARQQPKAQAAGMTL